MFSSRKGYTAIELVIVLTMGFLMLAFFAVLLGIFSDTSETVHIKRGTVIEKSYVPAHTVERDTFMLFGTMPVRISREVPVDECWRVIISADASDPDALTQGYCSRPEQYEEIQIGDHFDLSAEDD